MFRVPPSAQTEPAQEQFNSYQGLESGRRFGTGHLSIPNISFPMTVFKPPKKTPLPHLDVCSVSLHTLDAQQLFSG